MFPSFFSSFACSESSCPRYRKRWCTLGTSPNQAWVQASSAPNPGLGPKPIPALSQASPKAQVRPLARAWPKPKPLPAQGRNCSPLTPQRRHIKQTVHPKSARSTLKINAFNFEDERVQLCETLYFRNVDFTKVFHNFSASPE